MTETQLAAEIGRATRSEGDMAQDGKAAQANDAPHGGGTALPVFYRRPRPLNATDHAMRSLREATDFRFALGTNSVVVNGVEFPFAMRHYPIVFTVGEPRAAIAVLGLADNENLFVGEAGSWSADCYMPAYVRRYPFILMGQTGSNDLVLCVDEEASLLDKGGPRALFNDGQPTKLVTDALEFCRAFHGEHLATREFVRAIAQQGLLVANEARVAMRSGRRMTLRGFEVIDEAKFNALPDEIFLEWRRRGWLHLIYCHLMSMANWSRLLDLDAKRSK
jgi:hypothetical protein